MGASVCGLVGTELCASWTDAVRCQPGENSLVVARPETIAKQLGLLSAGSARTTAACSQTIPSPNAASIGASSSERYALSAVSLAGHIFMRDGPAQKKKLEEGELMTSLAWTC